MKSKYDTMSGLTNIPGIRDQNALSIISYLYKWSKYFSNDNIQTGNSSYSAHLYQNKTISSLSEKQQVQKPQQHQYQPAISTQTTAVTTTSSQHPKTLYQHPPSPEKLHNIA